MCEIRLADTQTVVMTTAWHRQRQGRVRAMLERLEFKSVEWVYNRRTNPHWRAINASFARVMAGGRCPLLILEDDATLVAGNFQAEIEVPEAADVLYLGGTLNAEAFDEQRPGLNRKPGGRTPWPLAYAEYDQAYIRIFNMHAAHALLFLNPQAMAAFGLSIARHPESAVDVCFAREMSRWTTLLVKRPFWYQDDGNNNELTLNYYQPQAPAGDSRAGRIRRAIRMRQP